MTQPDPLHEECHRQNQELRRIITTAHEEINRLVSRVSSLERTVARLDGKPVNTPILGDCPGCSATRVYLVDGRLCPICDGVEGKAEREAL